jgi:hypothetical protein
MSVIPSRPQQLSNFLVIDCRYDYEFEGQLSSLCALELPSCLRR